MGAQISPRFDLRSSAGAQTKAIDPVSKVQMGPILPGYRSSGG